MSAAASFPARAGLVCHPDPSVSGSAEFTYWADVDEARQAEAELTPCGPQCIGVHTIARLDTGPEPRRRSGRSQPLTAESALIPAGEVNS